MDAWVLTNGRSALNPDFPRGRALQSGLRPIPLQGNAFLTSPKNAGPATSVRAGKRNGNTHEQSDLARRSGGHHSVRSGLFGAAVTSGPKPCGFGIWSDSNGPSVPVHVEAARPGWGSLLASRGEGCEVVRDSISGPRIQEL